MARPKSPMWLFPLLEVRPPSPNQSKGVHGCLASCWNQYNCLCLDLSFPVGKAGMKRLCLKSQSGQEKSTHELFIVCQAGIVGLVTMVLLPLVNAQASSSLSWWRHCCRWWAGISTVIELALLPLLLIVKLASSPLLWWCRCCQCAGVFAIVTMVIVALVPMVLLLSFMCRHLRHCWASIVALVACCQAGVFALVVMASLPSMRR
jgi:hypothetical protein